MGKYAIFLVLALTFSMLTYSYALRNSIFISNERNIASFSQGQAQNISHGAALIAVNSIKSGDDKFLPESAGATITYPNNIVEVVLSLLLGSDYEQNTGSDISENDFEYWDEMGGSYSITVKREPVNVGTNEMPKDSLIVYSTGKYEDQIFTTRVGLERTYEWDPLIDVAVHADKLVDLQSGEILGDVSINSRVANAVNLGASSQITGNLLIGPNEGESSGGGGLFGGVIGGLIGSLTDVISGSVDNILGDLLEYEEEKKHELPEFPEFPSGYLTGGSIYGSQFLSPSDYDGYYIPEIDLGGNSTLTIDTGGQDRVLYVGKFNVQSSDVEIVGGGSLTMYVENHFDLKGRAKVNEHGNTNNLMLYYKGDQEVDLYDETLDFSGNTVFNGSIYADKADVNLTGTTGIQGNVLTGGDNVNLTGNAEAITRLIMAPHATVTATGNFKASGSIISDEFLGSGNMSIIYDQDIDLGLAIGLWLDEPETRIAWWD